MRRFLSFVTALLVCVAIVAGRPARVIITAGQSNTDGRCSNTELPAYIKALAKDTINYQRGAYSYCRISQNRTDGKFDRFWPKATKQGVENSWAYDAVTYLWLDQMVRDPFYVIKWAVGGTSIAANKKNKKGNYWYAEEDWLSQTRSTAEGGQSLLLSLTQQIDACIDNTLSALKDGYQVDALLWHQGESDYKHGRAYYDNLKGVFIHIRQHLTRKTGRDYSQLPVIMGTVARSNKCYSAEVEEAMKRLAAEDANIYLIDMSRAGLQRDRLHFDAKSAEYLGIQVYDRLLKVAYPPRGNIGCRGKPFGRQAYSVPWRQLCAQSQGAGHAHLAV